MSKPLIATAAIIYHENQVLLVKRAREPFSKYWALPSGVGAFEKTSNPEEAVKLEVKWDLDCDFNPIFFTYKFEDLGIPTIILFFSGGIKGEPKITHSEFVSEFKWFSQDNMAKMKLAFCHNEIIERFFRYGNN